MTKVYVTNTENTGKGLFAKTDIKKNEVIFVVKGKLVKGPYSPSYYKWGSRCLAIDKNIWIYPLRNNPWWYINHSCEPNVGLRGKVTVVAMKNITKGEEIVIDYAITEDDPYWRMNCKCEKNNCRKIIKSVRFLSEKIFKKYKPFIPKFLQKSHVQTMRLNLNLR